MTAAWDSYLPHEKNRKRRKRKTDESPRVKEGGVVWGKSRSLPSIRKERKKKKKERSREEEEEEDERRYEVYLYFHRRAFSFASRE